MHMADALISPAVGATMWAATAATTAYCARRVRDEADPSRVPLMGVTGAFVFAAQMVNFTIPGTGSSGHLGGGLLLAILLGPEAAFLVMASVLTVQALFFADGGLLALGANIFNLGVLPAFVAFPLVRRWVQRTRGSASLVPAAVVGAVVALLVGALGVVLETTASGVSELPFVAFASAMLPIHLAIGLVEGAVTAAVIAFVRKAQPDILDAAATGGRRGGPIGRVVIVGFVAAALVAGLLFSRVASVSPDGLEWSIARVAPSAELESRPSTAGDALSALQDKTALFPDYSPKKSAADVAPDAGREPAVSPATALSGLVGGAFTLVAVLLVGLALRRTSRATGS